MFRLPTRTLIGSGVIDRLPELLPPGVRVLVVTDSGLRATPWPERVLSLCRSEGRQTIEFDEVEANPRVSTVDRAVQDLKAQAPDVIVALGGGSVIDAAKGIAVGLRNPGSVADYEGKSRFQTEPLPLVAIPTTCGTGSEVTWVSVLTLESERRKISVKGDGLFPAFALADSRTLATLPPHLVASTGMDALTHAIEAYVSNVANPASNALAEAAVRGVMTSLSGACSETDESDHHRESVMTGSTLAGMAFGNADVGAVHCLSESIGGRHDLPHGLLNAVLLVPVLRDHGVAAQEALDRLAERTGMGNARGLLDRLGALVAELGLPPFKELGVPLDDFEAIAEAAARNGSNASNPRPMAETEYAGILHRLVS